MRLNLGAGERPLDGYENLDAKGGHSIWPLMVEPGSVDEIRASHVLEHFPFAQVPRVLADWVSKLKPGGTLKIAVPDFGWVAQQYVSGQAVNAQGFVMGGQVDALDHHHTLFDEASLRAHLEAQGLVSVRRWKSEIEDCASLPVSLNLAGTKPGPIPKVSAIVSMPRLGFNDFWACAYRELGALGIPLRKVTGAYWDRDLAMGMEQMLADESPEWLLTCDYDTVFDRRQVQSLLDVAARYPHADAIAPLQTARHHAAPMFTCRTPDGELVQHIAREALDNGEVIRAETAHFGLTLFRAEKLRGLKRPWFPRSFDDLGGYGEGGQDPDVAFWHRWKAAGNTLYVALRVPVGHCELMIRWPDRNLEMTLQRPADFWNAGPPANVWR